MIPCLLRTAGYRDWIPLIDILGMLYLMGEITAMPEVWASLFPSLVSRGRITALFHPQHWSSTYELTMGIFAVVCKPWGGFEASTWRRPQAAFFVLKLVRLVHKATCKREIWLHFVFITLSNIIMFHMPLRGFEPMKILKLSNFLEIWCSKNY